MAKKDKGLLTGDPITYQTSSPAGGVQMETFIPWTLVKRGVKRQKRKAARPLRTRR